MSPSRPTTMDADVPDVRPTSAPDSRWAPLSGGTAVWVFMAVEIVTFGLFLLGHAWGWREQPAVFAAGQARLHAGSGAIGTVLLLLGSGAVYQGALAHGDRRLPAASAWMTAAALAGGAFCLNKIHEYSSPELAGVTLSTSRFFFGYLFLTGLHLLHVVAGVGVLGWLALRLRRDHRAALHPLQDGGAPVEGATVEAAAAYWHLVDVVWILVFPIIYLMHP